MTKKCYILISIAVILCLTNSSANAANILAFLPTFSPSHLIIEMAVVKAMAERDHNVTVVSALPLKPEWSHPSMTHIHLDSSKFDINAAIGASKAKGLERFLKSREMMNDITKQLANILQDPKLLELRHNRGNKFDLMLYGYLFSDFFLGLAEHFDCPVALLWPNILLPSIMNLIGNPLEISYTTLTMFNTVTDDLGFMFRLKNLFAVGLENLMLGSQESYMKTVYEKHFPADKYVSYEKARERVAMVLFSHHFSEKPIRPLVPALIEIGGIHLNDEPKPLPKDIVTFVNSAEHGIIFFSLGTNVKANHLQNGTLDQIYSVLSKLPQKVLWKCDDESNVPGNSSNILYRKWLPQGDILGHPNVKLFFGHGGKGGITEAKFYGVPMVGLPIFGDQPMNMEEVVAKGYGLSIEHDETLCEEIIYKTVKEVLENPSYANTVKRFSNLYRDRPLKVKDNAVYWLEYLIRYKGAPHLQSPLKSMSFIEKTNLDVMLLVLVTFYVLALIIKFAFKLLFKLILRLVAGKSKKD